jgi:hypothetical protein
MRASCESDVGFDWGIRGHRRSPLGGLSDGFVVISVKPLSRCSAVDEVDSTELIPLNRLRHPNSARIQLQGHQQNPGRDDSNQRRRNPTCVNFSFSASCTFPTRSARSFLPHLSTRSALDSSISSCVWSKPMVVIRMTSSNWTVVTVCGVEMCPLKALHDPRWGDRRMFNSPIALRDEYQNLGEGRTRRIL